MKKATHFIVFILLFVNASYSQHIPPATNITPHVTLSLDDKVNKSDYVVEGQVINETRTDCFLLDPQSRRPFTSVIIRISKIFKGEIKDTIIELIIEGGRIPSGEFEGVQGGEDGSSIGKGQEGIFFLRDNNTKIQSGKHIQSCFFLYFNSLIVYDTYKSLHETRIEGKTTSDFEKDVYTRIESITGTPRKVIELMPFEIEMQKHPPNLDGDTTITFPNGNRLRVFKKDLKN